MLFRHATVVSSNPFSFVKRALLRADFWCIKIMHIDKANWNILLTTMARGGLASRAFGQCPVPGAKILKMGRQAKLKKKK